MNDVIGFIRVNPPRYTMAGQIKAMHAHKVARVIHKGGKLRESETPEGMQLTEGDADTVLRTAAPGRVFAVHHAHLLANPKLRGTRGGTRGDFRRVWDVVHQKGAIIWELYTNRRSDKGAEREAIALDAVEALAMGRHKTSTADKRGRPAKKFTPEQWSVGELRWKNRRLKTWAQVQLGLPKGMTNRDLWSKFGPRDGEET